jgi:hypothetical protein
LGAAGGVCGANEMLLHGAYEEKRVDVSGAFAGWPLLGGLEFLAPMRDVLRWSSTEIGENLC